jgi:hypothetical protein
MGLDLAYVGNRPKSTHAQWRVCVVAVSVRIAFALSSPPVMQEETLSWLDKMKQAHAEMAARNADPWRLRLERLNGKIGDDGIERIPTQTVFDILEIPQRNRSTSACRRLAKLLLELGWTAVRVRGLTRGGYLEQVRGYCRHARQQSAFPTPTCGKKHKQVTI